jgi:hypothetical protein
MSTKKQPRTVQHSDPAIGWLARNKKFIRFTEVERHLEIPAGLLSAQLQGHQDLSAKHLASLNNFIKQIGKP